MPRNNPVHHTPESLVKYAEKLELLAKRLRSCSEDLRSVQPDGVVTKNDTNFQTGIKKAGSFVQATEEAVEPIVLEKMGRSVPESQAEMRDTQARSKQSNRKTSKK